MIRKCTAVILIPLYLAVTTGFAVYDCRCGLPKLADGGAEKSCCSDRAASESCCEHGNHCGDEDQNSDNRCSACLSDECRCSIEMVQMDAKAELARQTETFRAFDFLCLFTTFLYPSEVFIACEKPAIFKAPPDNPLKPSIYRNCQLRL